jgi:hypothetical protein
VIEKPKNGWTEIQLYDVVVVVVVALAARRIAYCYRVVAVEVVGNQCRGRSVSAFVF